MGINLCICVWSSHQILWHRKKPKTQIYSIILFQQAGIIIMYFIKTDLYISRISIITAVTSCISLQHDRGYTSIAFITIQNGLYCVSLWSYHWFLYINKCKIACFFYLNNYNHSRRIICFTITRVSCIPP